MRTDAKHSQVWTAERRTTWDRMVTELRVVRRDGDQDAVMYLRFMGKFPTQPRDLLLAAHWRVLPDGAVVIAVRPAHQICATNS